MRRNKRSQNKELTMGREKINTQTEFTTKERNVTSIRLVKLVD